MPTRIPSPAMADAISVQQLAVTFPGRRRQPPVAALRPLDLAVAAGSIVGVLGPNGSGKTTLLRVLAGLERPTAGRATVHGLPPGHKDLRRRVGFVSADPMALAVLSAPEYLAYVGAQIGLDNTTSDQRARHWLERLELTHAGRRPARTFSTGMQKRLLLAAALLGEPDVLLLDEPTSGLDPFGSALVTEILRERAAAGTAVLMASHQLLEVEEICAEVLVLQRGEVAARGRLGDLLARDAHAVVVRGLDADGLAALTAAARRHGGDVLGVERPREHLFVLFRRLARGGGRDAPGSGS
jgi:ABC-2 type transport system ATP-binding protein